MPKKKSAKKRTKKSADPLRQFSADVPLGNNDPTVRYAYLGGGQPNWTQRVRGGMKALRGKYT